MPTMSTLNTSINSLTHIELRSQNSPALLLSPTPSNASSHHSQRTHHSAHSNATFGSNHRPSAVERKRIVATCRALRAQIAQFQESFIALYGHRPKGSSERPPLATTYAQYSEIDDIVVSRGNGSGGFDSDEGRGDGVEVIISLRSEQQKLF